MRKYKRICSLWVKREIFVMMKIGNKERELESRIELIVDGNNVRRIVEGKRRINSILLKNEDWKRGKILFWSIMG